MATTNRNFKVKNGLDAVGAVTSAGLSLLSTTSPITLNGSAGTSGQILTSAGAGNTPTWTTPSFSNSAQSGTATGGAVSVSFATSYPTGVTPIVVVTVLTGTTASLQKPTMFTLYTVTNTGFTGQVWSSNNTSSPYNDFVTATGRTIHWIATT